MNIFISFHAKIGNKWTCNVLFGVWTEVNLVEMVSLDAKKLLNLRSKTWSSQGWSVWIAAKRRFHFSLTHTHTTKDTNGKAEPYRTACQAKIWEHIFDLAEQWSDPGVHSGAGPCPSSICPSFCIVGQQRAVDEVSQIEMNLYSSGTAACKTQLLFFHPFSGEQHVLETVIQRLRCWQPSFS